MKAVGAPGYRWGFDEERYIRTLVHWALSEWRHPGEYFLFNLSWDKKLTCRVERALAFGKHLSEVGNELFAKLTEWLHDGDPVEWSPVRTDWEHFVSLWDTPYRPWPQACFEMDGLTVIERPTSHKSTLIDSEAA